MRCVLCGAVRPGVHPRSYSSLVSIQIQTPSPTTSTRRRPPVQWASCSSQCALFRLKGWATRTRDLVVILVDSPPTRRLCRGGHGNSGTCRGLLWEVHTHPTATECRSLCPRSASANPAPRAASSSVLAPLPHNSPGQWQRPSSSASNASRPPSGLTRRQVS